MSELANKIKIPTESSIVVAPFTIGNSGLRIGLNVHKIVKVVDLEAYDPLPASFHPFVGVMDSEDMPVPICDLDLIFRNAEVSFSEDEAEHSLVEVNSAEQRRVIICNFQNLYVGILVNRTRKLEQYSSSQLLPAPEVLSHAKTGPFFSAMIRNGQHYTYLLDLEGILSHYGVVSAEEPTSQLRSSLFQGKRVLVVEDASFFRKRGVQFLEKHGAKVDAAINGREGLELYLKNKDQYDLIFTDIEMPVMNGIQMAAEIRHISSTVPIIFNSAISNPVLIEEVKQKGLGDYIIKFDEKTILAKLSDVWGII